MEQARVDAERRRERRAAAGRPKQIPVGLATNPVKVKASASLRKVTKRSHAEVHPLDHSDTSDSEKAPPNIKSPQHTSWQYTSNNDNNDALTNALHPALAELSAAGLRAPQSFPPGAGTKLNEQKKSRKATGVSPKDRKAGNNNKRI